MIRLICLDMDGVLAVPRNFWMELHHAYGTEAEGKELTARYLRTDYPRLIQEVVGRLWKGKPQEPYLRLVRETPYSIGIAEFFAALRRLRLEDGTSAPIAIITSGPFELADRIAREFGVEFIFANQLVFHEHKVSGEFRWPVGDGTAPKARIIETLCADLDIPPQEVLYVGDSATDLDAFRIVGVSIAFNDAPQELKGAATHVVASNDLRDAIPTLTKLRR